MVGFLIGNDRIEASNRLTCTLDYEHHTWQKVHGTKERKADKVQHPYFHCICGFVFLKENGKKT